MSRLLLKAGVICLKNESALDEKRWHFYQEKGKFRLGQVLGQSSE